MWRELRRRDADLLAAPRRAAARDALATPDQPRAKSTAVSLFVRA